MVEMLGRFVEAHACNAEGSAGDGSGGASIYGGKFNDEKAALKLKHDRAGVVGFANSGKVSSSNHSAYYGMPNTCHFAFALSWLLLCKQACASQKTIIVMAF